ncbi:hypothetical protein SD37_26935 [Amycolatopsis orientalis]|uniref:Uncharacterized protein n=1 Tax=Amycolatopsis orientalis TaxID=31958 RepID=A0A193C3E7_AMYOR|nr:hypothetical protein [Amycolatopsis orientalis]ANN18900.1 hypothetical protein SD37_26935 [Amycolatopsis orientalis]
MDKRFARLSTDAGLSTITFYSYGVEVLDGRIEHHLGSGDEGPERIRPDVGYSSPWDQYLRTPLCGTSA